MDMDDMEEFFTFVISAVRGTALRGQSFWCDGLCHRSFSEVLSNCKDFVKQEGEYYMLNLCQI